MACDLRGPRAAEVAAISAVCLIHQGNKLLDRCFTVCKEDFVRADSMND